jgi:hypothetical protein
LILGPQSLALAAQFPRERRDDPRFRGSVSALRPFLVRGTVPLPIQSTKIVGNLLIYEDFDLVI